MGHPHQDKSSCPGEAPDIAFVYPLYSRSCSTDTWASSCCFARRCCQAPFGSLRRSGSMAAGAVGAAGLLSGADAGHGTCARCPRPVGGAAGGAAVGAAQKVRFALMHAAKMSDMEHHAARVLRDRGCTERRVYLWVHLHREQSQKQSMHMVDGQSCCMMQGEGGVSACLLRQGHGGGAEAAGRHCGRSDGPPERGLHGVLLPRLPPPRAPAHAAGAPGSF